MGFLNDSDMARMTEALGVAESSGSDDTEVEDSTGVETSADAGVAEGGAPSSEGITETVKPEATDVKEGGREGWVPRSRLNDVMDRYKAQGSEMEALRKQLEQLQSSSAQRPEETNKDSIYDELISKIWGEDRPEHVDTKMLDAFSSVRSDVDAIKQELQSQAARKLRATWEEEIALTNKSFMEEHGFEVPSEFVWRAIRDSKAEKTPHEVMEEYRDWIVKFHKKQAEAEAEAEAGAEEKTPAAPRSSTSKRSGKSTSKKKYEPTGKISDASRRFAEKFGLEY